jgi:Flp pilus assembly protein TadG
MTMRTALIATTLALAVTSFGPPTRAQALARGFDSAYAGESAFLTIQPGQTFPFQVFFMNTGQTTWRKGTSTQVNLTVCLENKVTCNVPSPNSSWNDGSWLSDRVYATHTQEAVAPGVVAAFTYRVRAPVTAPEGGTYRFNGDLALASGEQIHPEGYYQEAAILRGP